MVSNHLQNVKLFFPDISCAGLSEPRTSRLRAPCHSPVPFGACLLLTPLLDLFLHSALYKSASFLSNASVGVKVFLVTPPEHSVLRGERVPVSCHCEEQKVGQASRLSMTGKPAPDADPGMPVPPAISFPSAEIASLRSQ